MVTETPKRYYIAPDRALEQNFEGFTQKIRVCIEVDQIKPVPDKEHPGQWKVPYDSDLHIKGRYIVTVPEAELLYLQGSLEKAEARIRKLQKCAQDDHDWEPNTSMTEMRCDVCYLPAERKSDALKRTEKLQMIAEMNATELREMQEQGESVPESLSGTLNLLAKLGIEPHGVSRDSA